jgi:hypothetical protein
VTITSCPAVDDFGTVLIPIAITSTADALSNYDVSINLVNGDTIVGSAWTYVENVGPGQSATAEAYAAAPPGQHEGALIP